MLPVSFLLLILYCDRHISRGYGLEKPATFAVLSPLVYLTSYFQAASAPWAARKLRSRNVEGKGAHEGERLSPDKSAVKHISLRFHSSFLDTTKLRVGVRD